MAVLQREGCFLIGESKFLRSRPQRDNVGGSRTRFDSGNRHIHVFAAPDIGVPHRRGGAPDGEAAVVAGPIAEVTVQDVEERRVTWPDNSVAIDMWMRRAALT